MQIESDIKFEFFNKYYFYPDFKSFNWDNNYLRQIYKWYKKSFKKLNYYMPFLEWPNILFVHMDNEVNVKNLLEINHNINAITYESNIVIFCSTRIKSLEDIFKHEMFHVGINQGPNNDKEIIPLWFNEAIAHYLGNNHHITDENIRVVVCNQMNEIKQMITNDQLVNGHKYWIELTKSIGSFFFDSYSKKQLKYFLMDTKNTASFASSYTKCFGVDLNIFINSWLNWIVTKEN